MKQSLQNPYAKSLLPVRPAPVMRRYYKPRMLRAKQNDVKAGKAAMIDNRGAKHALFESISFIQHHLSEARHAQL